jgi:hypothetical protein
MRRLSLSCFVTALVASNGAFAQDAAQPTHPSQTQTPPAAQSRPAPAGQPTNAMQSRHRRQGPITGNQVQAPSPDTPVQNAHSATSAQSATETRPDARYPHPSGQDSAPDRSPRTTKLAAAGSGKDKEAGRDQTREATPHSKQEAQLTKRKTYTGNTGSKADPGTACTTARPTVDGGVDCGTSGNSATLGKIVTKPHQ